MGKTRTATHREVEFKLRVPKDFQLESFMVRDFAAQSAPIRQMSAVYFDTPAATLLRWGITMRHRSGGTDDGWHLKIPIFDSGISTGASVRSELHVDRSVDRSNDRSLEQSTDRSADDPPAQFMAVVGALLRDSELVPIARVETTRTPFYISHSGERILEVVSDHVQVYRGEHLVDTFHEIEVELLQEFGLPMAEELTRVLTAAGATPSSVSKASAGFGAVSTAQPDVPKLPLPKKSALPVDLVRWALTRQVRAVLRTEVQSHIDHTSEFLIYELNLTSQILSMLAAYLDPTEVGALLEEIQWLTVELSSPERIHADQALAISALDVVHDPLDRHEALLAIESYFNRRGVAAQSSAIAAQRSDRYLYFFSDVMDFATEPPVTDLAFAQTKIWNHVDPEHLLIFARVFQLIFPKKSRKILNTFSLDTALLNHDDTRELLRRIAMDPHTTVAGAYSLGSAVGRLSVTAGTVGGESRG